MADDGIIVKQGWLLKRGEYIRNWRSRWFQLKEDGSFRGFKQGPPAPGDEPINRFDLDGSTLTKTEDGKPLGAKGKKFGFLIRFMQLTRFVERSFHCETAEERDEWVAACEVVKKKLEEKNIARRMDDDARGIVPEKTVTLDDFEMLKVLGKGTFGKVMLGREKSTRDLFAIKVLKKDVILEKEEVGHTMTENAVLQSTDHPFLTGLKYSFQTKELLCFVMEYVNGGELFFHLSKEKLFTEPRARYYAAEITLAITYLHDHGIIYRDLKLENLLLDRHGHIKITDFGLCKEEMTYGETTRTFCGTPEYLAPEIIEDNDYGRPVDWWGVGVVLYEMLCGHLPFYNRNHEILFELIMREPVRMPEHLSEPAKDILSKLLDKDPSKRLGCSADDGKDVMAHAFFASIDFEKLYRREIPPPFVPQLVQSTVHSCIGVTTKTIKNDEDVSNFDEMFTTEKPEISPTEAAAIEAAHDAFSNFDSVAKA